MGVNIEVKNSTECDTVSVSLQVVFFWGGGDLLVSKDLLALQMTRINHGLKTLKY